MIFWIVLAVLIIGIVWYRKTDGIPQLLMIVFGTAATIVALVGMFICYSSVDGYVRSNEMRYESLVYQYENGLYDKDNDFGKKELMSEIQKWNEDLASNKVMQDNLWFGIFIPNVYDQFEFIKLDHGS